MFYESEHSTVSEELTVISANKDLNFPMHLHKAFELIAVTEGEMTVCVDKQSYTVNAGEAVLVFPHQVHSMETVRHSKNFLIIFAPEYIKAFVPFCLNNTPKYSVFKPSEELWQKLKQLQKEDSTLHIKSVLYSLADEFDRKAEYSPRCPEIETLLYRIFDFIHNNYTGKCDLHTLSDALSYQYNYLSRYFADRTGMSFTQYVQSYRLSESCYKLTNSGISITQIAMECGFESLRSFHRNFFAQIKMTPGQYRKKYLREMAKKKAE
ncbi:MAG: AraC family transcriptional regulator [Firmicutes bacterium]|nr:AraC family transcriptional regulator [Bacillota bacterium]